MYAQRSIWEEIKDFIQSDDIVKRIVSINVSVFLVFGIIRFIGWIVYNGNGGMASIFLDKVGKWLYLPSDPNELLTKPWTFFTHMFLHIGIFHLLFNMMIFYFFGQLITEFIGRKKVLPLYIYGGLTGGILFVAGTIFLPNFFQGSYALGASAAVMAFLVASATLLPDFVIRLVFFGDVKLKFLALALLLLDLLTMPAGNSGGHLAHIGGALFGFIFIKQLQAGHDWTEPFYYITDGIQKVWKYITGQKQRDRKLRKVYSKSENPKISKTNQPVNTSQQRKLDDILDKINTSGYESLSTEEKEFLFRTKDML